MPEGGTNALAIEGCKEILNNSDTQFDTVCCCVGTGGTLAGLIEASASDQEILGFPALMHRQLEGDIQQWTRKDNWALIRGFEFGGYARTNEVLGWVYELFLPTIWNSLRSNLYWENAFWYF